MNNEITNTPEVSIVFTSYNHKTYLRQALDALTNQTFQDFELIIVDDCSTDGSQIILTEYAEKDPRIKLYLNVKNSGSYVNSTNYAASLATAPFVIFAQCDDFAERNQIEILYNVAKQNPNCGVIFSASNIVNERGEFIRLDYDIRREKFKKYVSNNPCIFKTMASELFLRECIIPNLGAALVDRSLFNILGGFSNSYKVLADWDFWLNITQYTDFFYVNRPLNNFRQHDKTIRNSFKVELQLNELYSMYVKYKSINRNISLFQINKSFGILFWGFVSPIHTSSILTVIILSLSSIKFHFSLPIFIYTSLFIILFNKFKCYFNTY